MNFLSTKIYETRFLPLLIPSKHGRWVAGLGGHALREVREMHGALGDALLARNHGALDVVAVVVTSKSRESGLE